MRTFRLFVGRGVLVCLSAGLAVLVSSLFLRITEKARAISIEGPESQEAPPARAPESLRVLTYNLSHGLGAQGGDPSSTPVGEGEMRQRLERIGEHLGTMGLDLVAVQSVDFDSWWSGGMDQASILAAAGGYPYLVRQRNVDTGLLLFRRVAHGNALLSRFPIAEAERIEFPPFRHWEKTIRGNPDGLFVRVRIGEDRDIRVLVTELDARSEEIRVRAAGEMVRLQRSSRVPMLVMGTLNSTPPGFPMAEITPSGQNAIELLESFGGFQRRPARGQATWHDFTYPTTGPRRIIDWILPDRGWSVQQYQILRDLQESEYYPVMGTFRLR